LDGVTVSDSRQSSWFWLVNLVLDVGLQVLDLENKGINSSGANALAAGL
jgi:hypothetical protein